MNVRNLIRNFLKRNTQTETIIKEQLNAMLESVVSASQNHNSQTNALIKEELNVLFEKLVHIFPQHYRDAILYPITKDLNAILTKSSKGQRILLDPRDPYITVHYLETGDWEPHVTEVIDRLIDSNTIFIDVGANIGLHSLSVGNRCMVFCYEPDPETFKILNLNFSLNGISATLFNAGAGNVEGIVKFARHSLSTGMTSQFSENSNQNPESLFDAKILRLDTLLENELQDFYINGSLVKNVIIKIDVEGFESNVLKGSKRLLMASENVNFICEYHVGNESLIEEIREIILEKNHMNYSSKIFLLRFGKVQLEYSSLEELHEAKLSGDIWVNFTKSMI